jgi:hypothetical protein
LKQSSTRRESLGFKRRLGDDSEESNHAYKQRKKAMSMKEGLYKLLEQSKEQMANATPILSWLPDGKR